MSTDNRSCPECFEKDGWHAEDCPVRLGLQKPFTDRRPVAIHFQGAGPLQVPAIKAAVEEWLYVYASDRNPHAPGLELAHEVLPSHDSPHTKYCNWAGDPMSKMDMRRKIRGFGKVLQPGWLAGDLVIKPEFGSGSVGVERMPPGVVVEQRVEGRHIDVNGVFVGGEFHGCGMMEHFPNEHHVPMRGNEIPADHAWYEQLERASYACGYTDGPVKGDFIDRYLIEVSPRFHGDVSTAATLPFGTGINGPRFWFGYLRTGEKMVTWLQPCQERVGVWRVIPPGVVPKAHPQVSAVYIRDIKPEDCHERDTTGIQGYVCGWGPDAISGHKMLDEVCGE